MKLTIFKQMEAALILIKFLLCQPRQLEDVLKYFS